MSNSLTSTQVGYLRRTAYGALAVASVAAGATIWRLGSSQPGNVSLADGVQTTAICLALIVAIATYQANSRNARIQRVYEFHQELTEGDIGDARSRLASLVYQVGNKGGAPVTFHLRELKRREVRGEDASLTYESAPAHSPNADWTLLVRFFERVWTAQRLGTLHDLAVVSLIGRHACWWDLALADETTDEPNTGRRALAELASWANDYQRRHSKEPRLARWGENRQKKFGRISRHR